MESIDLSDVRMVITPHDLERVGRFRYSVYVEEQGKRTPYADHIAKTLIEPEDRDWNSRVYWVEREGSILGTVRAQRGPFPAITARQLRVELLPFPGEDSLLLFTRMMVAPEARHSAVTGKLFFTALAIAISCNVQAGVLSCNPNLIPLFEMFGCATYADPFVHTDAGMQQPMAVLGEVDYLRQRGSPLAYWVSRFKADSPYTNDFLALVESHRRKAGTEAPRRASRLAV